MSYTEILVRRIRENPGHHTQLSVPTRPGRRDWVGMESCVWCPRIPNPPESRAERAQVPPTIREHRTTGLLAQARERWDHVPLHSNFTFCIIGSRTGQGPDGSAQGEPD
jgi:hypothetical protein